MRYCSQYVFDLYIFVIIIDEEFNVKTNICVFENQQEVDQFKNKDISIERNNGLTYIIETQLLLTLFVIYYHI